MKKLFLMLIVLLNILYSTAQTASLSLKYGTNNEMLNQILSFDNVGLETLNFKSSDLKGKYYQIFVKEFANGKLLKKDTLFDGSEMDFFKIQSDSLSFNFFSKTDNQRLKLQLQEPRFNSKKLLYDLKISQNDYALKDFLGHKKNLIVPIGKPFYLFAIITPTIRKDGFGSYCEVAQSDVNPENFGTVYHISHYFLVEMVFK